MTNPFKTPILFIVFNRPETTQIVFDEIRKLKPKQLFVSADGSRVWKEGETEKCAAVRKITEQVDWDCEVLRRYSDVNLGCKIGASSAVNWFFEHVEEGIILEDDCVPSESFFGFCEMMLDKYRDDKRVMMVSGTNYLFNDVEIEESYFFSRTYSLWGWATWRRAWALYDIEMKAWPYFKEHYYLKRIFQNNNIVNFYTQHCDLVFSNKLDTWDPQWVLSCLSQNGLGIVPKYNLISNIGIVGTHTGGVSKFTSMPTREMTTERIIDPPYVSVNFTLDDIQYRNIGIDRLPWKPLLYKLLVAIGIYPIVRMIIHRNHETKNKNVS